MSKFVKMEIEEFKRYIEKINVSRKIKRIQLHHTYAPSYKNFNGKNHETLQSGMRNYHVKTNGWSDIAQHFTVFPDGLVMTGRSLDVSPAGIYGANTGAICIECVGNFDKGADVMNHEQKETIVTVVRILLDKFSLTAEDGVTYHAWWTSNGSEIGDYVKGKSAKTCPGTNFFGGNSFTAYENNLMPLIKNCETEKSLSEVTEINDIVWELNNAGVVSEPVLWMKKCNEDINVYWLCRKMANRICGVL